MLYESVFMYVSAGLGYSGDAAETPTGQYIQIRHGTWTLVIIFVAEATGSGGTMLRNMPATRNFSGHGGCRSAGFVAAGYDDAIGFYGQPTAAGEAGAMGVAFFSCGEHCRTISRQ